MDLIREVTQEYLKTDIPDFRPGDNQLSIVPVWVSNLALVIRDRRYEPVVEGLVLDAASGEPLRAARETSASICSLNEMWLSKPVRPS